MGKSFIVTPLVLLLTCGYQQLNSLKYYLCPIFGINYTHTSNKRLYAHCSLSKMDQLSNEEAANVNCLSQKFEQLNIDYQEYRHPAANTMEQLHKYLPDVNSCLCKNLLLKDKKTSDVFLITAKDETKVNLKTLGKQLGCPNLRFADDDTLMELLHVLPGSISPLALMNDIGKKVKFLLDESLKGVEKMVIHPLINKVSWAVNVTDIIKFVLGCNHQFTWINLEAEEASQCENISPATISEISLLGLTVRKEENFAEWYTQVVTRSEMIDYYEISGCYILRPLAYFIWEEFQHMFNRELRKLGVSNSYFPMFVTKSKLETEKNHIDGFSPEVAWVCKCGNNELPDPIAIRPTSETIMYPYYSKWIRSHRDLPLCLNQWNNAVRWEFKQPTPFLRSREYLWQEGHTGHASEKEAMDMVLKILELYRRWYEDYLAVPVIKGWKSENEKFAGSSKTTTIETIITDNGRGIQAATSHLLGQNFSKMFDMIFIDDHGKKEYVWQTSWGCTTRSIGAMIMVHGDNKGIVLPPKVAMIQVIIIPITYKNENFEGQITMSRDIKKLLDDVDIRAEVDDRENYTPGWKYNHWELKGVPIRIEIGPKEVCKKTARLVRRDTHEKLDTPMSCIVDQINSTLSSIQNHLFQSAKKKFDASIVTVLDFKDVIPALINKKIILAPWCGNSEVEEEIKKETQRLLEEHNKTPGEGCYFTGGMKTLCIPFEQPSVINGDLLCFYTKKPAIEWAMWGRSY